MLLPVRHQVAVPGECCLALVAAVGSFASMDSVVQVQVGAPHEGGWAMVARKWSVARVSSMM